MFLLKPPILEVHKCIIALAQLIPDVCSLVPFPKKKQGGAEELQNYTIPSI